jgi:hypothetical protein
MLTGSSRLAPSAGVGYVAVTSAAISVVWLADVFVIISLASRAFARYYLMQTLLVVFVLATDGSIRHRSSRLVGYASLAAILAFVVIFAIPADS